MNFLFNFNSTSNRGERPQPSSELRYDTGVILANLGSPDTTRIGSIRQFLRDFLSDRRVVDVAPWKWYPILHLFVLPFRPFKTQKNYQKVWLEEGSPLIVISERQRAKLELKLGIPVEMSMTYGNPDMETAFQNLREKGCQNVLALPLFPQYSQSTSAAVFDRIAMVAKNHPYMPNLRFINSYSYERCYRSALTKSIQNYWKENGEPDRLLISFHGIPVRYVDNGDPYKRECEDTFTAVAQNLSLPKNLIKLCYQSKFGGEPWLEPNTVDLVKELAHENVEVVKELEDTFPYTVDVVCPGFSADCLETLEEIAIGCRDIFCSERGSKKGRFRVIPCLNDSDVHIEMMADILKKHGAGWI